MNSILLVEDEIRIRESLRSYLKEEGFEVTSVSTLAEGRLEIARGTQEIESSGKTIHPQ